LSVVAWQSKKALTYYYLLQLYLCHSATEYRLGFRWVFGICRSRYGCKIWHILHGMVKRVGNPVISDEVCVRVCVVFWWWIKIILSTNVTFWNVDGGCCRVCLKDLTCCHWARCTSWHLLVFFSAAVDHRLKYVYVYVAWRSSSVVDFDEKQFFSGYHEWRTWKREKRHKDADKSLSCKHLISIAIRVWWNWHVEWVCVRQNTVLYALTQLYESAAVA